jgi:hypothetical protein
MTETLDQPVRGRVGVLLASEVGGWAWDPGNPDEHLMVEIRSQGQVVGRVTADMIRPDLAKAGIGKGDHGFVFRSPKPLPVDQPGAVAVFARGTAGRSWRLSETASQRAVPEPLPEATVTADQPALPFPAQAADRAQHPVFILGATRSGTSALAQAVTQNTRYVGPAEGHVLDLIWALTATVDRFYQERAPERSMERRTLIAEIPASFFTDGLKHLFVELARAKFPSGYWLDKTLRPEMIRAAPLLRDIWPDAKFIFLRRDPIDNIVSGRRKFPDRSFASLCHNWADSVRAWNVVRDQIAPNGIEVDQATLATSPGDMVRGLSDLIGLTQAEADRVLQSLKVDRPERTSPVFAARDTAESAGWTSEQISTFTTICGPLIGVRPPARSSG